MKIVIVVLLVLVCFSHCSDIKESITFTTILETDFNSSSFQLPAGIPDSLKQAHDSCMGFAFDVNALFIKTRDTFGIGSIVSRQTLKQVSAISNLGISQAQLVSLFNVITNPCYEKRTLHFPLKSLLGDTSSLSLPGASPALNKELSNAIAASGNTNMSTGSWVYLDMRSALLAMLDTTQSKAAMLYKQNLLDTANMILTATENVTDVSFLITTPQNISKPLLELLQTKPSVITPGSRTSLSLQYISDNKFQLSLNGFSPLLVSL